MKVTKSIVFKDEKLDCNRVSEWNVIQRIEKLTKNVVKILKNDEDLKLIVSNTHDKEELDKKGLFEFEDYVFEKYIAKKIVVIYGNCHTMIISQLLENCSEFLEEHIIYPIKPIQIIKDVTYFDMPAFRYCDIFIHQSIQLENRYGKEYASQNIINKLSDKCRVIAIPNVYRLPVCFFPQYSREKELCDRKGNTIFFRDKIIDKGIEQGKKFDEIVADYKNENYYSSQNFDELFEQFCDKVRFREREWDIKVLDYILKNYQSIQLFYDPNHPTNEFLIYVTSQVLLMLGINHDTDALRKEKVMKLDSFEMPIHSSVKKNFQMSFTSKEMRTTGQKVYFEKMYLEEYITQYLSLSWKNASLSKVKRLYFWRSYCKNKIGNCIHKFMHNIKN